MLIARRMSTNYSAGWRGRHSPILLIPILDVFQVAIPEGIYDLDKKRKVRLNGEFMMIADPAPPTSLVSASKFCEPS